MTKVIKSESAAKEAEVIDQIKEKKDQFVCVTTSSIHKPEKNEDPEPEESK